MATDIVGSNMPSKNGYGQNGFTGASSDEPGKKTTSGFLPQTDLAAGLAKVADQVRTVGPNVPDGYGMKKV